MQATLAPLSANALPASAEVCSGLPPMASMPPAARKFLIQVARAAVHRKIAEHGQEHLRALAGLGHDAHRRRRAARSNGSARRCGASGATDMPPFTIGSAGGCGVTFTPSSASIGNADTPVSSDAPAGDALGARLGDPRDLALDEPALQRARHAALGFDLLEQLPGFPGQLIRQLLDEPGAVRRDRSRVPSALSSCSTRCVLRAMRRAKASGLPSAQVKGSTVIASAPPNAAPAQADGGAQHVHPRIAPRHHALRGGGRHVHLLRRHAGPAGIRDARHQPARRAQLGDGQEQVGIGRQRRARSWPSAMRGRAPPLSQARR